MTSVTATDLGMFGLGRRWFEARALAVLQEHLQQPIKVPLPSFEQQLLRGAVVTTRKDGGTPFDAALRYYAAYAETTMRNGGRLVDIGYVLVRARLPAIRDQVRFFDEHDSTLRGLRETEKAEKESRPEES